MQYTVSLPPELEGRLHDAVAQGGYADPSAVVTAALQAFFDQDSVPAADAAWWRAELGRRRAAMADTAAGWVDGEAYFAALEQRLAELPDTV